MSNVHKHDMTRIFGLGKIRLSDTVSKSSGSCVVNEAEDVQIGDSGRIDNCTALDISEPSRHGDHNIVDGRFQLMGCDITQLSKVSSGDLCPRVCRLLAAVYHLKSHPPSAGENLSKVANAP